MLAIVFVLSGNIAFALGGGGGGGDGRLAYLQQPGVNAPDGNNEAAGGSSAGSNSYSFTGTPGTVVSLPEPVTVLLFGSGLIVLAGLKRKFRTPAS